MENLTNYIKPELLVLIPVLYFIGRALKGSNLDSKWIPFILGLIGIILSAVYVVGVCKFNTSQAIAIGIFTAIVQGVLVAGCSTYTNELIKQFNKE